MDKGSAAILVSILLILISLSVAALFFAWGQRVNKTFKESTENIVNEKIMQSKAGFFIATIAENKIAIKNNGEVPLNASNFQVYLNDTLVPATPENPSNTEVSPGDMLYLVVSAPDGNYTVRVSGPYGKFDELFGEIAKAWLSGFDYRRNITITEKSGNDLTNYQILITLTTSNFDYSKTQSDGSDIRFTDSDKTTRLSYWIEDWNPVGDSKIWVEIPSLSASSSKDIYMYYGNTTPVSSESNGTKTFLFFDDMETWNGWSQYGSGKVTQSSTQKYEGVYSAYKSTANDPNGAYKFLPSTLGRNIIMEAYIDRTSLAGGDSDRIGLIDDSGNGYGSGYNHASYKTILDNRTGYSGTSYYPSTTSTDHQNTWYESKLIINSTHVTAETWYGGVKEGSVTLSDTSHSSFTRFYIFGGYYYYVDLVRIRKYTSSEPTYAISTNEETR
ncbi:MAG: DUF2341 domain-containing protein [Candidatus Aenigmarchaeota archaeon]|nr:DUF2341 domain-containing protein [Candidatus Aenigmarchaeota archaeon]